MDFVQERKLNSRIPVKTMETPLAGEPGEKLRVAVVGCSHGELEIMYDLIESIQARNGYKIDLLLCCGDFQSVRNEADLACMACPVKVRSALRFLNHPLNHPPPIFICILFGRYYNDAAVLYCFYSSVFTCVQYRSMVTFWKYYSGEKVAPVPTVSLSSYVGINSLIAESGRNLYRLTLRLYCPSCNSDAASCC